MKLIFCDNEAQFLTNMLQGVLGCGYQCRQPWTDGTARRSEGRITRYDCSVNIR